MMGRKECGRHDKQREEWEVLDGGRTHLEREVAVAEADPVEPAQALQHLPRCRADFQLRDAQVGSSVGARLREGSSTRGGRGAARGCASKRTHPLSCRKQFPAVKVLCTRDRDAVHTAPPKMTTATHRGPQNTRPHSRGARGGARRPAAGPDASRGTAARPSPAARPPKCRAPWGRRCIVQRLPPCSDA